jgi:hypothetical protein
MASVAESPHTVNWSHNGQSANFVIVVDCSAGFFGQLAKYRHFTNYPDRRISQLVKSPVNVS